MKSVAVHDNHALHVNVKSFNILRAITDVDFFSKVQLSPTARLIMFSLANMYNPRKGFVFPKNNKLIKCTGSGERSISQAISELKEKGIIVIAIENNFRKIYFTQKTYKLLGLLIEDDETIKENEAGESLKTERKILGVDFGFKVEKIAGRVEENTERVEKIAGTCHEQKKEHVKKQFFNFGNEFKFRNEKAEIREAFNKESCLTNRMHAEIILNGYHRYNVKKDSDFIAILRIKKVWDFKTENFQILNFIEEKRRNDKVFADKIEVIENDVDFSLIGFEKEIQKLRKDWENF